MDSSDGGSNTGFSEKRKSAESEVFEEFFRGLDLRGTENDNLKSRGLSDAHIEIAGFKSWAGANDSVSKKALKLLSESGTKKEETPVPGFYYQDKILKFWNRAGLIIPVRDAGGNIVSAITRPSGNSKVKYLTVSSKNKPGGRPGYVRTHCPLINKEAATARIRVTEGPLKADVACALGDKYCIGVNGVGYLPPDFASVLEALEVSELSVCFDQENNLKTKSGIVRIIEFCKEYGIDCVVETWDDEKGKGIDDVLFNHGEGEIRQLSQEEIDRLFAETGHGWVYVVEADSFCQPEQNLFDVPHRAICFKLGITPSELLVMRNNGQIKVVDSYAYWPGQDRFVKEGEKECLNRWSDPGIKPRPPETPEEKQILITALKHFRFIMPDGEYRKIMLDYIAWICQRPGEKMKWCLMIVGEHQQTGKSTIVEEMIPLLLGDENVTRVSSERLMERFNDWQVRTQVATVDEVSHRGRYEVIDKLKICITEKVVPVRFPGGKELNVRNRYNLILTSNHKDALALREDDKRFCVIHTPVTRNYDEYYQNLYKAIRHPDFPSLLLGWFLKRNLTEFEIQAKSTAPETRAKLEMVEEGEGALTIFFKDAYEEYKFPLDKTFFRIEDFVGHPNRRYAQNYISKATHKGIAMILSRFGMESRKINVKFTDTRKSGNVQNMKPKWSSRRVWFRRSDLEIIEKMSDSEIWERYTAENFTHRMTDWLEAVRMGAV